MWLAGPSNSLEDVAGVRVGHAQDRQARTGVSVVVFERPAMASLSILGQAPGTRECALLDPARTVQAVDGFVLAGGSAFGLAAADAVMGAFARAGRGFRVGDHAVPIVPAAILFDLGNGGSKPDDLGALYRRLGEEAFSDFGSPGALGSIGAGTGATTGGGSMELAGLNPGGLGTASARFGADAPPALRGHTIAALVAVNAVGSPYFGDGPCLRAAPFECAGEFGGLPPPSGWPFAEPRTKLHARSGENTTIGCLVTTLALSKAACHNLAVAGQDGIVAAIYPAHTALDGDLVFAASTGRDERLSDPALTVLVHAAATATMARAIARAIHAASGQAHGPFHAAT